MPYGRRVQAVLLGLAIGSACALRIGQSSNFTSLREAFDDTGPGHWRLSLSRGTNFRTISAAYDYPQGDRSQDEGSRWKRCDRARSLAKDVSLESLEPLAPALAGKRVRLFGDSIIGELTRSMAEMPRDPRLLSIYGEFVPLLPHRREDLLAALDTRGEVTVLAAGIWYNWDWKTPHLDHTNISPNTTASLVAARCKQPLPPFKERTPYGRARRDCGTNDWESYVSDLKRLASVVRELKGKDPTHRFIVKSVPPQFFAGAGGGNWQGEQTDCVPITKDKRPMAELRNTIAREILGPSGDFEFVDTFGEELEFWGLHPVQEHDCSHFCNPSAGTWLPVRELLKQIALR